MSGRRRSRGKRSVGLGAAGFLLAVLFLTAISWPLTMGPLVRLASTIGWQPSECTIEASEWREPQGGRVRKRSRTLELRYSFEINGRLGEGTAINASELDGGMRIQESSRRSGFGTSYDVGTKHLCWVEPQPPHRAVLKRTVTMLPWLLSGVLAILMLAALGGAIRGR